MSTPLSPEQLAYLRYVKGAPRSPTMTARGLVARGCLAYRWGRDPSHGYTLTNKGRRLLEEANKND